MNIALGSVRPRVEFRHGKRKMPHAQGASTGPRTVEGLERSRRARWKHGLYSAADLAEQKRIRELLIQSRGLLNRCKPAERSAPGCIGFIRRSCPLAQWVR
jgi:hypothetical protein